MATDGHCRGSETSHNIRGKKYAKEDGMRKMSQEEIDRELDELRIKLNYLRQLLQRKVKENQRQGWNMKKKVKWPVKLLFEDLIEKKLKETLEELKQRMNDWMQKEKLRGAEFKQRPLTEEEVHYCEPKQGDIHGEEDEEEERLTTILMNYLERSYQHEDVLIEASDEAIEPYAFETDNLCIVAGYKNDGVGKSFRIVMRIEKDERILLGGRKEEHNPNYVMKKDETRLSHKENQRRIHTQLANEIVEGQFPKSIVAVEEELAPESNQVKDIEKHLDIVLTDFEGEVNMLEDWLIHPKTDEIECIEVAYLIQTNLEQQVIMPNNSGMHAEEMQQHLVDINNNKYQQWISSMH
jgi:ribosomal protein L29